MFCSNCGTVCPDGSNFCMKCGYNFAAVAAPAAAPVAQPAAEPVQAPVPGGPPPVVNGRPWIQNSGVVNPNPVPGYEQFNPTFHCRCEYCYFEFNYHTYDLGHRAWYPHGFIYCPRCNKPIRHRLEFEVRNNNYAQQPTVYAGAAPAPVTAAPAPVAAAPVAPAPAAPANASSDDDAAAASAAATTTMIT